MIAGLKPYPAVKNSGVEALGDIPESWNVVPVARLGSLYKGRGGSKEDEAASGVPCIRYGDLYTRHEFAIRGARSYVSEEKAESYTEIAAGDLLFAASGETVDEIGKSAVNLIEDRAVCGGDIIVLRPRPGIDRRFLGYVADALPAREQKAREGRGFTVVHIYPSGLKRLALPVPPLADQAAIVRFLDHIDARIQCFIAAKERLIELLEEEKQAIIHRAVTSGLDPDVPLKPSGVEWLGDVPEHWEVRRLKSIAELRAGASITLDAIEEAGVYPVYGGNGLRGFTDSFTHDGDRVLIGRQGALCGNVHVVSGRFWASEHAIVCDPRHDCPPAWLAPLLRAMNLNQYSMAAAQPGLATDRLRDLYVPVPPPTEREAIARAATQESRDGLGSRARRQITLLHELRTRLFSDVVTGKLDVREAAAELPAEPDAEDHSLDEQLEEVAAA